MTTLSPSGSGRRRSNAVPVVLAVVAALAVGLAAGWWFAGRDSSTPVVAAPSTGPTCHNGSPSPTGSHATTSAKPATAKATTTAHSTAKSTAKPSGSPAPTLVALPSPSAITVNVYNATTRKGLAKTTSLELASRGFRTDKVANDPAKKIIAASAEIRYGPAGAVNAKVVAAQVVGPVMIQDHRKDASVDFVLGDGYASLATPEQASAVVSAIASPTASGC
jgi:LytR cell envelope-related transcriptional attenuator